MEQDLLEKKTNFIISSKIIIESSIGPLFFVIPSFTDKQISQYYYDKSFEAFKRQKIATVKETIDEHKKLKLWSDAKDEQLDKLEKFIKDVEEDLKETKQSSKIKKLTLWKKFLERSFFDLLTSKNTMLANTCETLANERALSYLIYKSFYTLENASIWNSYNDLIKDNRIELIRELINKYIELNSFFSVKDIRYIARMPYWRTRWNVCKSSAKDLFNRELLDISNEQFLLIYWSQIYDSVYEAYERPPDSIIEDDDKLDNWLKEQGEKNKRDGKQKYHAKNAPNKAGEIFQMVDGYYNDDGIFIRYTEEERWKKIDEIKSTNSPLVRNIRAKEEAKLANTPNTLHQEHLLRRSSKDREIMGGKFYKPQR